MAPTLVWGRSEVAVHSLQELDALLDRLAAEAERDMPFMVTLAREDGTTLSIGLGREESTLSHVSADGEPPYHMSRGDLGRDEPIEFFSGGEMTEFAPESAIRADAAREALRFFYETGELSPKVDWDEL